MYSFCWNNLKQALNTFINIAEIWQWHNTIMEETELFRGTSKNNIRQTQGVENKMYTQW